MPPGGPLFGLTRERVGRQSQALTSTFMVAPVSYRFLVVYTAAAVELTGYKTLEPDQAYVFGSGAARWMYWVLPLGESMMAWAQGDRIHFVHMSASLVETVL